MTTDAATLALFGGPKAAERLVYPAWPIVGDEERRLVNEVLESGQWGRLGTDIKVDQFEQAFADYQGAKHGIAVANGTLALELCLLTVGIRPLDEVIVPAITFIASALSVVRVGAIPIFADSDPATISVSAESIEAAITERTRAILCVHYGGYPCDMDAILSVAARHGLAVIEDCAHAQGTEWRGKGAGSIGTIGAFSFQSSKALSVGEGGIVLTDDDDLAERARLIHHIGRKLGQPGYQHYMVGSNYRLGNFQAAVGLAQLQRLPEQVRQREVAGEFLASELQKIGGLSALPRDPRITRRGYYFMVLKYDASEFQGLSRDRFIEALNAEGVPVTAAYGMPLYRQPAFDPAVLEQMYQVRTNLPDYEAMSFPVAEKFCAEEQVVISHAVLLADRSGLELVIEAVRKIKMNARSLL